MEEKTIKTNDINKAFIKNRPLSYSSLKHFKKSPLHYYHYITTEKVDTDAMAFGRLFDTMLLDPDKLSAHFVKGLDIDKRSKENKAKWAEFYEEHQGKTVVSEQEWEKAEVMCERLMQHKLAGPHIRSCTYSQQKLSWTDPKTKLPLTGYKDCGNDDYVIDIKTIASADEDSFMRSVNNFEYYLQNALYLRGERSKFRFPKFIFIVIEKSEPHGVGVYTLDKYYLEYAEQVLDHLLQEFTYCMENELFHESYEFRAVAGFKEISLPGWLRNKLDD